MAQGSDGWSFTDAASEQLRIPELKNRLKKNTIVCVMQTHDWVEAIEDVESRKNAIITKFLGMGDLCEKVGFARYLKQLEPLVGSAHPSTASRPSASSSPIKRPA